MIHVGIDLHTQNMVNVAINDKAEIVLQADMPTSTRSLVDFFAAFDQPVQAVVECMSNWYWLSDWCREHNIPLPLAHAKMVKAISYAKVKTDKVDAKTLAELLRADLIPEACQAKPDRRELRELTRGRLRMIQWRGSCRLRCGDWRPSTMCRSAGRSGAIPASYSNGYSPNCHQWPICKLSSCLARFVSCKPIFTDSKKKLSSKTLLMKQLSD